MEAQTSTPARFEALDALRGICALLVVLFHIPVHHAWKGTAPFVNLQACVDVFFVLSGFVLCHACAPRLAGHGAGELGRFIARRIARLWPLHAAMLAALVLLELAKYGFGRINPSFALDAQPFSAGHAPHEIATNLLFLQSFGLHPGMSWNGPAWSVAVEFYLSILFALIVPLAPVLRRAVFLGLAAAAAAALLAVSPDTLFVSTDWGVLRCALGFFGGCLLYDFRASAAKGLSAPGTLETLSLAALIGLGATVAQGPAEYLFPIACAVLVYVFSFGQGPVSRLMRAPIFQRLGLWSYSIYMVHSLIFQVLKSGASFLENRTGLDLVTWHNDEKLVLIGSPEQAVIPAMVLSVVLVVPLAALSYRFIEKPGMERFGALLGPRRRKEDGGARALPIEGVAA